METSKAISGVAYVAMQADIVSREDEDLDPVFSALIFQCARIKGARSFEEWNRLVTNAKRAEASVAEAIEFGEDEENAET